MTPASSRPPIPGDLPISTPTQWAQEVEKELAALDPAGRYQSAGNTSVLVAWAQLEGGHWHNTAMGNPLGTTLREPGSSSINSVGVQSYTSWREGLAATVSMLRQGNMAGILAALRGGSPNPANTAVAIGDSPWLNGHTSAPGTPTPYGDRIISLLGKGYAPPTNISPSPGAGQAPNIETVGLGLHNLTDPFGLLGGAAGAVGGVTGKVLGGAIGDIEDYIGKFAIRAALVIFGAVAVLLGLAILFRGGGETKSTTDETSTDDEGEETETRSTTRTRSTSSPASSGAGPAPKGEKGAGHAVGADVKQTAEGAAEAV